MNLIEVTSLDDPRLDVFARLTEAQLRNRLEPEKRSPAAQPSRA